MSSDRKPRLVPLYALGIAYVAVRVLVTQLSGEPGGLKILLVLAVVAFLAATARGLLQYRGWAWLVTIVAMVLGLMVGQVRVWLAVDQADYTEMNERMLFLAFLGFSIWYLGREKVEVRFRPHIADASH